MIQIASADPWYWNIQFHTDQRRISIPMFRVAGVSFNSNSYFFSFLSFFSFFDPIIPNVRVLAPQASFKTGKHLAVGETRLDHAFIFPSVDVSAPNRLLHNHKWYKFGWIKFCTVTEFKIDHNYLALLYIRGSLSISFYRIILIKYYAVYVLRPLCGGGCIQVMIHLEAEVEYVPNTH